MATSNERDWQHWPTRHWPMSRRAGFTLWAGFQVAFSWAPVEVHTYELPPMIIRQAVRRVRRGRTVVFTALAEADIGQPIRGRVRLTADELQVLGLEDDKVRVRAPLAELRDHPPGPVSGPARDQLTDEAWWTVEVGHHQLESITAAAADLAVLGCLAGWPGPEYDGPEHDDGGQYSADYE